MNALKFSSIVLVLLAFGSVTNGKPSSEPPNSNEPKREENEKLSVLSASATTKTTPTTTVSLPETAKDPSADENSCGGLRGFFHLCDSSKTKDSSKNVEKRSLQADNVRDSNESKESKESLNSSESKENSDENSKKKLSAFEPRSDDVQSKLLPAKKKRQIYFKDIRDFGPDRTDESESSEETIERF